MYKNIQDTYHEFSCGQNSQTGFNVISNIYSFWKASFCHIPIRITYFWHKICVTWLHLHWAVFTFCICNTCNYCRSLVFKLQLMNTEAERCKLYAEEYLRDFQTQYALIVVELGNVNREIQNCVELVDELIEQLVPFLTDPLLIAYFR